MIVDYEAEYEAELARHEEWIRRQATRCPSCPTGEESNATNVFWIRRGVYFLDGVSYCDACSAKTRDDLSRKIGAPGQRAEGEWWDERPRTQEDVDSLLERYRKQFPPPKRNPWPYRSTVSDVA